VSDVQPEIPNVPAAGDTPQSYVTSKDAEDRLSTRYGLTVDLADGILLAATMAVDEEAPFIGVKYTVTQEREWPRTFKYGWPNMLGAPSPIMVSNQLAGAFYLDYEGVVPEQVVDWVCLEAYRMVTLPFDRSVVSESVTGISVRYDIRDGISQLDRIQASLLSPFLIRQGHSQPFINFT
jgi:hypothetical protein